MKRIVIIDFGSQVTQLIARRIRELQVYCELYPHTLSIEQIKQLKPNGIILSGGPNSVYDEGAPKIFEDLFSLNIPILGICYGMQMIAHLLGGKVISGNNSEFGHAELNSTVHNPLWEGLPPKHSVWMSHGDHVESLPKDFVSIASTDRCPIAAMKHLSKPWFGVQFHPEVTHTTHGYQIIRNFVLDVCQMETTWTIPHFIDESIEQIKKTVGSEHVVLGLSGGVDSSVAAALIHRAIGHQLHCVFVDTGLLRLHEGDQVMATFAEGLGIHVIRVNAEKRFFSALKGIHDPEEKRKIIGKLFVDIFQEEASGIPNAQWLAQGTIYPDVIESAGQKDSSAHTIKSHHNVGGLPDSLSLKLLEPLRKLFKDEVRELGLNLSLPSRMIFRHPFPGPGLGVRILGEVRPEYVDILRFADAIFMDVLYQTMHEDGRSWYEHTSQAFAVFLPVKSVGVMGDGRTYDYVIALRAVVTQDFMTAHWASLPYELLAEVSNRIINQVPHVNRVVYDISGKPPATIEWE
jgi:GMP synthase (glutamine-hydrolysing)